MKKLPLALAVSLIAASSSLSAATIYEKDGFKFKMDGDIQIQSLLSGLKIKAG
jgi:predicted porin